MRFSVSVVAEGDREIRLEEVVELADAVAPLEGIASGMGSMSYGAQFVVEADDSDTAVERAIPRFEEAARRAGLPQPASRHLQWRGPAPRSHAAFFLADRPTHAAAQSLWTHRGFGRRHLLGMPP